MTGSDASSLQEDLEHYRILSETASDYAFKIRIGPDGIPVVEWMSENWARDFGYEPESPTELFGGVHPDDHARAAQEWAELLAGRSVEGDIRLLPRSGGVLWVHHRTRPIIDPESGRVIGTYGAMQDIHERKMAEDQWRQAEARFRAQFRSSPIPTYTWQRHDDDFVLIDFNEAAQELTKGGIGRMLGRSAREMFAEDPDIMADLNRVFDTGDTLKTERLYRMRSTGEDRQLLVTVAKVPPNLVLVHTIDVTEWKQAEAEREALQLQLRTGG
jgi:PAS domain S-box-containing protein